MAHHSAVNHHSLECSAAEMKAETIPSLAAILTLPQEIRDQIYSHLLTSTYRVNLTPIKTTKETVTDLFRDSARKSFALQHYGQCIKPEHHSPQRDTTFGAAQSLDGKDALAQRLPIAPIYSFPPTSSRPREQQASIATTRQLRNTSKPISNRLSILLTSKGVRQDAIAILFKEGFFRYVIASPGQDTTPTEIKNQMQNIELCFNSINFEAAKPMQKFLIHLNLLVLAGYPIRPSEAQLAAEASNRLISNIATAGHNMISCVIRMCHYGPSWACPEQAEFLLGEIAAAVIKLTRSKTVVLRLLHENGLRSTDTVGLPRLQAVSVREHGRTESKYAAPQVYGRLDELLSSVLGPSETVTNDGGYYTLTYHPQSHLDIVNSHTALGDRGIGTAEGSEESGVSKEALGDSSLILVFEIPKE